MLLKVVKIETEIQYLSQIQCIILKRFNFIY